MPAANGAGILDGLRGTRRARRALAECQWSFSNNLSRNQVPQERPAFKFEHGAVNSCSSDAEPPNSERRSTTTTCSRSRTVEWRQCLSVCTWGSGSVTGITTGDSMAMKYFGSSFIGGMSAVPQCPFSLSHDHPHRMQYEDGIYRSINSCR